MSIFTLCLLASVAATTPASDATRVDDLKQYHARLAARVEQVQSAYDEAIQMLRDGKDLPTVREQIAADPGVKAARRALRNAHNFGGNVDRALMQLDDAIADARSRATSDVIEHLRHRRDVLKEQMSEVNDELRDLAKGP